MTKLINWAENRLLPDAVIRSGIRHLLKKRIHQISHNTAEASQRAFAKLVNQLKESPIAVEVTKANEQHYEIPTEFYKYVLGPHMKYSSCYFPKGNETLSEAEAIMLDLSCQRAELCDGQDILELGCGWGSLTLWMAAKYPRSRIVAVSNSSSQKKYIDKEAQKRGLGNITIVTCDMNRFTADRLFDRIVSIEMFEHMRNWEKLLRQISTWLKADGKLFVHIFTHQAYPYLFEPANKNDWMSSHFFTGGMMPSDNLFLYFQDHTAIENQWVIDGTHYQKTARAWLANIDKNKNEVLAVFAETYGREQAPIWLQRWRIFFMACEELWGYRRGREWRVCHYLFKKRAN